MAAATDENKNSEDSKKNVTYVIINNIPKFYHAADLRNFFSEFVETKGFDCFHFRHRPEVQKKLLPTDSQQQTDDTNDDVSAASRKATTCCIVRVHDGRVSELVRMYDKKHWVGRDGQSLSTRCFIKRVRVKEEEMSANPYRTRGEQKSIREDRETFSESDLKNLIEMHPPPAMPNGNVGTPTKVFLEMIRACRFPPYLIKKLGLEFPRGRAKGLYGSVPFDYGTARTPRNKNRRRDGEIVRTGRGDVISEVMVPQFKNSAESSSSDLKEEEPVEKNAEESDDDECEEWDRHEALHNDVTSQERTRERLFEEEMEVVWEKGGSGLVFYTDASHWDQVEGDFDAKTSDDWDVDMSIYYDPGAGDKDARDFVSMRHFSRLREGEETEDENRMASFEKYTKGFGSRIMKGQGWREGDGLGRSREGIAVPVDDGGKHPWDRSGLGYRGEKLVRQVPSKRRRRYSDDDVLISTVYDRHEETDPAEPLLRSNEPTFLKFKKPFVKGGSQSRLNLRSVNSATKYV